MSSRFKPLNNYVVVRLIENAKLGSILIPETARMGLSVGEVVSIAAEYFDNFGNPYLDERLKVGTLVYFHKIDLRVIKPNSDEYLISYTALLGKE